MTRNPRERLKRTQKAATAAMTPRPRRRPYLDKILCLEGEWSEDLRRELSVEPVLQILKRRGEIQYIHRRCGTKAEFAHYLNQKKYFKSFRIIYLAFHGARGLLQFSPGESVTLEELPALAPGAFKGRLVYFGSCSTVKAVDERLKDFLCASGAVAVAGYTKDVNWVESSAFELMFLYWAAYYKSPHALVKRLASRYPQMEATVGFKYYYAKKTRGHAPPIILSGSPRSEIAEPDCRL